MTPEIEAALIDWAKSAFPGEGAVFNHLALLVDKEYPAEPAEPAPEWEPATFAQCLRGDRIRLAGQETDVLRSNWGTWHADTRDMWRPKSWDHDEIRLELAANPGAFQPYPLNMEIEILCTPERRAALNLQRGFPGSTEVIPEITQQRRS